MLMTKAGNIDGFYVMYFFLIFMRNSLIFWRKKKGPFDGKT